MPELVPTAIATPFLASRAKDALRMEEKKMPAGLIFDATSIVRVPGGYMDYVTGDTMSAKDVANLKNAVSVKDANPKIKEYINLPELYSVVPTIGDTTVEDNTANLDRVNAEAAYEPGYNNIAVKKDMEVNDTTVPYLAHELQHALDYDAINNQSMRDEYYNTLNNNTDPMSSVPERRAYLVEAANRIKNEQLAKQAIFNVLSKGLPVNAYGAGNEILRAAAINDYLNSGNSKNSSTKK